MTDDDFRQFGSVEYIQQRTYYRTSGNFTQDLLHTLPYHKGKVS